MPKLTKRVVDAADHRGILEAADAKAVEQGRRPATPTRDAFLWDEQLPGFGLRVTAGGVKSFILQYRDRQNRSRRLTLGRYGPLTAEAARDEARKVLGDVARGENPAAERRAVVEAAQAEAPYLPTVADLAERYMEEHAKPYKATKSVAGDRHKLDKYILPRLREVPVADVAHEDVKALKLEMKDTPPQANQVLALLSKMFTLAEEWSLEKGSPWYGVRPPGSNPVRYVRKYKEESRQRYLSTEELAQLGTALRKLEAVEGAPGKNGKPRKAEHWSGFLAVRLLLLTGARLGEILSLRWEYVDLERGFLNLPESKTGAKVITLGSPAVKLLKEAPRKKGSPWVCPSPKAPGQHLQDIKRLWARLKAQVTAQQLEAEKEGTRKRSERVSIADVRLHDLRHTFASVGAGASLGLPLVGALLGHKQTATTERYAHLANDPVKQAAGVIAGHIAAVLEGKPPAEVLQLEQRKGAKS